MAAYDKSEMERILLELNANKWLFPQFEFTKLNNELQLLGGGGFSYVYEMYNKERPEYKFALKVIGFNNKTITSEEFWNTSSIQWILCQDSNLIVRTLDARELLLFFGDNHEIVEVKDALREAWEEKENSLRLQFVLMEKLDQIIELDRYKNPILLREKLVDNDEIMKFALEIGQALNIAHGNKVLHRDIKIENVFYDSIEGVYKLGDFGIAKYAAEGNAETVVYTNGYGAPEIERRLYDKYNATADIYSFGMTLYLLLNDMKFPGSDRYFPKVEVQYDPDFVFPAPIHASAEMANVIRKMCSFHAKDRYQCMADVLSDLLLVAEEDDTEIPKEMYEMIDMATETYHEVVEVDEEIEDEPEEKTKTRAERKLEQEAINQIYLEENLKFFALISAVLLLMFLGMKTQKTVNGSLLFWTLPIAVTFEAFLQKIKEMHLLVGTLIIGLIGISILQTGFTMPHIIMLVAILIGCPLLTVSSAVASGIWMAVDSLLNFELLNKYDLGWIFLIILFLLVNRYFEMRVDWEKTTYTRAFLARYIYDKMFIVLFVIGIVLFGLQKTNIIAVPMFVEQLHFARVGIISFIGVILLWNYDGYLDDDIYDEEGIEDEQFLDE